MAFTPQDFVNGNVLNDSDLDTMDGNIDEVRSSHKGAAQPPSLVPGVRWIDDSTAIWASKIYDGGGMLTEAHIDPVSDLVYSAELRRKNLIWNGNMDCWQDGVSETGVTTTTKRVADGYLFGVAAQGTWTVDRQTVVPTVAQAGQNLNFSLRALVTTTDATTAAGDFALLEYTIEGFDYQELYQQPQHFSFWVRSSLTGTFCVALRNSAEDRSFVFEYTINAANTYELKQFVLRAVPSGGTWDFQEGRGLSVGFVLAAGTTFHTTANAWQTGNFLATSSQVNLAVAAHSFFITDVRLVGGTVRSPVIFRSFSQVLIEAQRRFWKSFNYATKPAQNIGTSVGAISFSTGAAGVNVQSIPLTFPVAMRATPTITSFNPLAANALWRNLDGAADSGAFTSAAGDKVVRMENAGVAGDGAGDRLVIHITADSRF